MVRNAETICDQKVAIRTAAPADCTWDIGIIDAAQPSTKPEAQVSAEGLVRKARIRRMLSTIEYIRSEGRTAQMHQKTQNEGPAAGQVPARARELEMRGYSDLMIDHARRVHTAEQFHSERHEVAREHAALIAACEKARLDTLQARRAHASQAQRVANLAAIFLVSEKPLPELPECEHHPSASD